MTMMMACHHLKINNQLMRGNTDQGGGFGTYCWEEWKRKGKEEEEEGEEGLAIIVGGSGKGKGKHRRRKGGEVVGGRGERSGGCTMVVRTTMDMWTWRQM